MTKHGLLCSALAETIRRLRKHPTQPTTLIVRQWKNGGKAPGHDMRRYIEVATSGGVPMEAWGLPRVTRDTISPTSRVTRRGRRASSRANAPVTQ